MISNDSMKLPMLGYKQIHTMKIWYAKGRLKIIIPIFTQKCIRTLDIGVRRKANY
jgi:hypothetical protein